MRNLKQLTKISVACGALCLCAIGTGAASAQKQVTVTIHRVAQMDDLDKDVLFINDKADFYAEIWIDGYYYKTKNFSTNDGEPMWTFTAPATKPVSEIRIRLWDDDGGFENKDDHVDINPNASEKDLVLRYDTNSHQVLNNVYARVESTYLYTEGGGDRGKGRLWFTVR